MKCRCPYVICPLHGNCNACIAKNIQTHDLCYCMEETAIQRGAKMPQRMPEQVFLEDSFEDMSRKSAELIAEVVRRKPDALVSLPAGSTAKRTYEILHEMAERHEVDFTRTEFVALDEWLDLEDESENCDAFMRKNFWMQAVTGHRAANQSIILSRLEKRDDCVIVFGEGVNEFDENVTELFAKSLEKLASTQKAARRSGSKLVVMMNVSQYGNNKELLFKDVMSGGRSSL